MKHLRMVCFRVAAINAVAACSGVEELQKLKRHFAGQPLVSVCWLLAYGGSLS